MKVFGNEDFGYQRITVERPLKLRFEVTEETLAALRGGEAGGAKLPSASEEFVAGGAYAAGRLVLDDEVRGVHRAQDAVVEAGLTLAVGSAVREGGTGGGRGTGPGGRGAEGQGRAGAGRGPAGLRERAAGRGRRGRT